MESDETLPHFQPLVSEGLADQHVREGVEFCLVGVETRQQFAFLREHACHCAQGYLIEARAVSGTLVFVPVLR